MSQLRVLVSGFAPFRGRPINTSSLAVRALERLGVPSVELYVLPAVPVVWADQSVGALAQQLDARLVIAVGEAAMTRELRLERVARNVGRGVDESGVGLDGVPVADGPPRLESTVPPASWREAVDALRHEGWNAERHDGPRWLHALGLHALGLGPPDWETSAGAFLCNATYYHLLREAEVSGRWVGFVHVRADGDPERLGRALQRIVELWARARGEAQHDRETTRA